MKIKVVVHEAEEGGYWAEVPAIPGCATQGETFEELLQNLYEAVEDSGGRLRNTARRSVGECLGAARGDGAATLCDLARSSNHTQGY